MNVTFDIITPVHNQVNFTKQYLDCMKKLPAVRFEITVINNGSTDTTSELLKQYSKVMDGKQYPKLHVETFGVNKGFAYASNYGYNKREGEIVIFLNNDIRTSKETWYEPIQKAIFDVELNDMRLVGATGGYIDEKTWNFKYETKNPKDKFNYLSGWCLGGRRNTFEHLRQNTPGQPIGPFIELFTTYFEDTYMGFLANKLNVPKIIVPCPYISHFGKVTSNFLNLGKMYISARQKFIIEMGNLKK